MNISVYVEDQRVLHVYKKRKGMKKESFYKKKKKNTLWAFKEASLQAKVTSTKASVCKSWWNTDVIFDW